MRSLAQPANWHSRLAEKRSSRRRQAPKSISRPSEHLQSQRPEWRDSESCRAAIGGRLQALSNAHTLLAQSRWAGASLHSLVTEELAPYGSAGISRARIDGPEILLEPNSAQAIAMVLHELTTNAVKYGALSIPTGRLRVEWSREGTQLVIRWSEAGGPPVKPPNREGFGTRVVGRVVKAELEGTLRFDWKPDGLACEIIIPLDQLASALDD